MHPTRQSTARAGAEPTVNPNSLKPTKQSLSASTPPPNRATCLLDATIGTNDCSSSTPYCVSGLIGSTCSVCDILNNGTSVGCTNEGETCGAPSCVRDLPLSCKENHEALCLSKKPSSLTPSSRKPMKPITNKPTKKRPTKAKPTTVKPYSSKPIKQSAPPSRKTTSLKPTA